MFEPPTTAAPPSDPPQDVAGGEGGTRSQQRLRMLRELAEIGLRLARGVEQQAQEPDTDDGRSGGDPGLRFSRIARAVRQTLALEARLEGELEVRVRDEQARREMRRAQDARAPIERRSRLVRRAVAQSIDADARDEDHEEQLFDDLDERLCDHEVEDDFLDRPIGELVARICKDLGVRADLSLWEDEDWALAEAAARAQPPTGDAPRPTYDPPTATDFRPAGAPSWLSG